MQAYGHVEVLYDNAGVSDHSPLVFECASSSNPCGRPFTFFNFLAQHSKFEQVVAESWVADISSTGLKLVWDKLKRLKGGLKRLHREELADIEHRIEVAREQLSSIQEGLKASPLDSQLHRQEKDCSIQLQK